MKLYPAIDLKDGQCVRLKQGVYEDKTVYSSEPWKIAKEFEEAGAAFIHLVDLDGARSGKSENDEAVRKIVEAINIPVEIGGGIRTISDIEHRLKLGVSRVIIGTKAVSSPEFIKEAVEKFGADKIVVGIDAKNGIAAVSGWEQDGGMRAVDLARRVKAEGVKTIIYTDIARDGMLTGPNIQQTEELFRETGLNIIASGGVASMEDLRRVSESHAEGVVFGKAIYEHRIDLAEAVKEFS